MSLTRLRSLSTEVWLPADPAEAVVAIQQAIDAFDAIGGGTVRLPPGRSLDVDGTIRLKSNVTLDLNGSTLVAVNDADFDVVDLGNDSVITPTTDYNPASIKPVIALIGTADNDRLTGAAVINGTIDGNGTNQPDDGSYANVAVFWADECRVDVTSLRARPGLTINLEGGANTGRRAFCLFVGNAERTKVGGYYDDSGYDCIGLRQGAVDTVLDGVFAGKATKGSVQVATGALRTRIQNSVLDNTAGTTSASHSLFCHSAKGVTVIGTSLVNGGATDTGSPLSAFGDASWGYSEDIVLQGCPITHDGDTPLFALSTAYVRRVQATDIPFAKTEASQVIYINGAIAGVMFTRWRGYSASTSTAIAITSASDIEFIDCDIETAQTANGLITLTSVTRARFRGGFYKCVTGPIAVCTTTAKATFDSVRMVASDSVQALGGNTDIDVIDCDLTGIINANKLRIFGADSGLIQGNKGAVTEVNGLATVPSASTSVTVSHGLWVGTGTSATPRTDRLWLPRDFQVSFVGDPGTAAKVWVGTVTTTQVTFHVDAAPGADITLAWSAAMSRRT